MECYSVGPLLDHTKIAADRAAHPRYVDPEHRHLAPALCDRWNDRPTDPIESEAVVSDIPTLLLSGQFDPTTVDGQRKCPPKWPAKMSLELLAMVSGHSVLTVGRFIGGLSACMYFFAVSRWMASSRATLRIDRPLRFAFCTAFHLAV